MYVCIDTYIVKLDISNTKMKAVIRRIGVGLGLLKALALIYFGMTCEGWMGE